MQTTCSRSYTKTFPSPIFPVRAAPSTASITRSTRSSDTAASIFPLGRKSTTYSAPRYSSVWPFCRPKPLTSVTVMPCTPIADSASRTSSSLKGLMIAVTSFMRVSEGEAPPVLPRLASERFAHRQHDRAAARIARRLVDAVREAVGGGRRVGRTVALRIAANICGAEPPAGDVLRHAKFVVGIVKFAVPLGLELAEVADYAPAATEVIRGG